MLLAFDVLGCGKEGELLGALVIDATPVADAQPIPDAQPGPDASTDGGSTDAATDELGPFGPPALIAALLQPDADSRDPTMTGDLRELFFASDRSGNPDIWLSARSSADAGWGAPSPVASINTADNEGAPAVSLDGLTLWFCRGNLAEIWVTTRASRTAPWTGPTLVTELDTIGHQFEPAVDEDSRVMLFASDRTGTAIDIYSSTRANAQSPWGTPRPELALDIGTTNSDPFVGAFGLKVWFTSDHTGMGDIYESERATVSASFGVPAPVRELNTAFIEADPTLSPDFRYIVFASNRRGKLQLYEATR